MKRKITISSDDAIIKWIDKQIKNGRFRNRSHGFEQCVRLIKDN